MNFEELLEENKKNIRENEVRKKQALEQFRELLDKHPFVMKCRQDDSFLLNFLRTRKYSVDAAVKTLESYFILRKRHSEWFDVSPPAFDLIKTLVRDRFFYMLKGRDSSGCTVMVLNGEHLNVEKYSSNDAFVGTYIGVAAALECHDVQIMGLAYVINYTNTPLAYFSKFSVTDVIDWVKSTDALPGRYKKFIIIGLPSFANALFNLVKLTITEKQRNRLIFLDSIDELSQHMDKKILTERFGGEQSEDECIENFIKVLEDNLENLKSSGDFQIDEKNAPAMNDNQEIIGSFRKLEID